MEAVKLRIALLQLLPGDTLMDQLEIGTSACRRAAALGADIVLFPEMWSCGYRIPQEPGQLDQIAIPADAFFVRFFSALAKELRVAIGITYLEKNRAGIRNTITLFDMDGAARLHYAKVHTCDFGEERVLTPGEDFYVTALNTRSGPVQVGAMICYDREFPESARILMLQGAELVLVPNACPMEINRLSQLRARAYENMLAVVTCNYPAGKPDCNGHSSAFDGVAYLPELPDSRDTCILEAGEGPGIYVAELDLAMLRAYRSTEVHGNAYRRPETYHRLLDRDIRPPFLRADRRE